MGKPKNAQQQHRNDTKDEWCDWVGMHRQKAMREFDDAMAEAALRERAACAKLCTVKGTDLDPKTAQAIKEAIEARFVPYIYGR